MCIISFLNSSFLKKAYVSKIPKKKIHSDDDMDIEDYDENLYNQEVENYKRNKILNIIKRRFCLAQKELIHFVSNYEYFVCTTVTLTLYYLTI